MTTVKVTLYLALVALALLAAKVSSEPQVDVQANNNSHHFEVGYRMAGDRLVLTNNVIKNSAWLQIVKVEKTFNTTRNERITMVQALDQKTNGNGAYVSLLGGGPGQTYVTLKFKSQRGHGINFVVQLYARP